MMNELICDLKEDGSCRNSPDGKTGHCCGPCKEDRFNCKNKKYYCWSYFCPKAVKYIADEYNNGNEEPMNYYLECQKKGILLKNDLAG